MKLYELIDKIQSGIRRDQVRRSAWKKGVFEYEIDMLDSLMIYNNVDVENIRDFKVLCLNGATDFYELSESGSYLVYDTDIAERLCNNTELKRTKSGEKAPNKFETWLDVQARALYQAYKYLELYARAILTRESEYNEKL